MPVARTQWQSLGRYRQARVHQDAANSMRPQATDPIPPAVYATGDADRARVFSVIGELGCIMQHENGTFGDGRALAR
jgi:hypothetical protein